jgi:hypothetical protein
MRLPAEMRGAYLERAIADDLTVEQVRADVDRRVGAWRDGNRVFANESSGLLLDPTAPLGAAPDAAGLTPDGLASADEVRRLVAQKTQVALRIEELETELRRHVLAMREIVVRLKAIEGASDPS